jgi:hypothetical protein
MYKYTSKFITKQGPVIWENIINSLKPLQVIHDIKNIECKIVSITRTDISYKVKTKNKEEIETIDMNEMVPILVNLKSRSTFDKDSVKDMFKGRLSKKILPILAILLACGVIEEVVEKNK